MRVTPAGTLSPARSIKLPTAAKRFTLTAESLDARRVRLNGQDLKLGAEDELPDLSGQQVDSGQVDFAPVSVTFLAIEQAENQNCK